MIELVISKHANHGPAFELGLNPLQPLSAGVHIPCAYDYVGIGGRNFDSAKLQVEIREYVQFHALGLRAPLEVGFAMAVMLLIGVPAQSRVRQAPGMRKGQECSKLSNHFPQ